MLFSELIFLSKQAFNYDSSFILIQTSLEYFIYSHLYLIYFGFFGARFANRHKDLNLGLMT